MKDSPRRLAAVLAIWLMAGLVACSEHDSADVEPKIEYALVTVGDPGNAADSTGFGAVGYTYRIGKYPVTVGEYTSFLNAVARADTYGLYEPNMGSDLNVAGISRSGEPGSYRYSVIDNDGDTSRRPIAYVSWFNAARFANWMENGQPSGVQNPATTEDGAYQLRGATSGNAIARRTVNPLTGRAVGYWIPTEDEWYKAAYFSPNVDGNGQPGYFLYATQSDTAPGQTAGSTPNQANIMVGPNFSVTGSPTLLFTQNYLTDVGSFSTSPSHYGTFDQNGNLFQWNDLDGSPFPYRGVRGSFWFATATAAQSIIYAGLTPSHTGNDIGFRLAAAAGESR